MRVILNNKILLRILSAVIAIILWTAITYTEDPIIDQPLSGIDVVFEGENIMNGNGFMITNKDSLPEISVTVRGNRSKIISAMEAVSASVDVSGISKAGENTVDVKYIYPKNSITLVKSRTDEIKLDVEKIVTRDIPIKIKAENADKNNNFIVKSVSADNSVKISGAENDIYKIAYAEVPVDVTNIVKSGQQEYVYRLCDEKGREVSGKNITYKSDTSITVNSYAYTKKTLPIKVVLTDLLREQYDINIKSQSITSIDVGLIDENVEISEIRAVIDEYKENESQYELTLSVPEGVYIDEEDRTVQATCWISAKVSKEIEVPVEVENVPDGKTVTVTPNRIKVAVKGAEKKLTAENIRATIDASKLADKKSETAVRVEATDGVSVLGIYNVWAEIK